MYTFTVKPANCSTTVSTSGDINNVGVCLCGAVHLLPRTAHQLPSGHHVIGMAPVLGLLCGVVCGKKIVLFKAKKTKKKKQV